MIIAFVVCALAGVALMLWARRIVRQAQGADAIAVAGFAFIMLIGGAGFALVGVVGLLLWVGGALL